jgi:SAM-dependent methyltransferase
MTLLQRLERLVNGSLSPLGIRVARRHGDSSIGGRRLSDAAVIARAHARGLSAGAYLEELFGNPGRSAEVVSRMRSAGAVSEALSTVLEIGPGSGLYIERVLEHVSPSRYEIYELERSRAEYLASRFPVTVREADGESLASTASRSVDLVHAHGVFVTLDFLTNCAYFREIDRVVAPGGWAVFDIVTDECLDPVELDAWLATSLRYLSLHSRDFLIRFFRSRGFNLIDEFEMPLLVQGRSRYFILRRDGP